MKVIALDNATGAGLSGAAVFIDDEPTPRAKLDGSGVAVINGVFAGVSVTIARKCSHPQTFVGVPVDTNHDVRSLGILAGYSCRRGTSPGGRQAGGRLEREGRGGVSSVARVEAGRLGALAKADWREREAGRLPVSHGGDPKGKFQLPPPTQAVSETLARPAYASPSTRRWATCRSMRSLVSKIESLPRRFHGLCVRAGEGVSTKPGETTQRRRGRDRHDADQSSPSRSTHRSQVEGPRQAAGLGRGHAWQRGLCDLPRGAEDTVLPCRPTARSRSSGLPPLTGSLEGSRTS